MPDPYTFRERWRFRGRPYSDHPRTSYQTRLFGTPSQRWFFVDGMLGAVVDVVPVQFLVVYAIAVGATDAEVGFLSIAAGLAGVLALAPGARIAELTNSRKWVVLWTNAGVARVALLAMALAPIFIQRPQQAIWVLIAATFVRSFMVNVSHASWVSLLADIVPLDLRRFYVTQRMLAMTVAGALTAPLVGFGIRWIGDVRGYEVIFALVFVVGMAASYAYWRIDEPARPPRNERPPGSTRGMLRDRRFIRYLLALLLLHSTTMVVGPFLLAYFVRDLGGSVSDVGLLATLEQVVAVAAQFLLGLWVTKFTTERLFKVMMFFPALVPLFWYLAGEPWHAAFPFAVGGLVWAVYNVSAFNLLLEYASNENIASYAAVQQIVVLFAQLAGPIVGTAIVAVWGIRTAMLVSTAGRLVAALVMFIPLRWIPAIRSPSLPSPLPPPVPGAITPPTESVTGPSSSPDGT
ncbi:MAG: MFS transporter [Chloroflexi bacterium]|nr:MFS transporter [Chloroflexota bacterium]